MYFFVTVLLALYGFRLWLAVFGGLHPDEAYYWVWSRHLALGYFDHPPMAAWIIRFGSFLVESFVPASLRTESPALFAQLGLRLVPNFLSAVVTPYLLGRSVEVAQKGPLRVSQMLVLWTAPIFVFGPLMVTPDVPFFAAWALCLYCSLRLRNDRVPGGESSPTKVGVAILLGIGLSLAGWSKYSAVLAAALVLITGAGLANSLIAGSVALLFTLPHLYWNWKVGSAEGVGVFFQFDNALGFPTLSPNWNRVGDLWLTQLFLWSPMAFFAVFGWPVSRGRCRYPGRLAMWALVPLIFFSVTGLRRPAEANWPLVGAIGALVLALSMNYLKPFRLLLMTITNVVVVVGAVLVFVAGPKISPSVRKVRPDLADRLEKPSRIEEFRHWENFHASLVEAVREDAAPVRVESYQLLSVLFFYDSVAKPGSRLDDRLRIWVEGSRRSQYHVWESRLPPIEGGSWLLTQAHAQPPAGCEFRQQVFRGLSFPTAYRVYRCR